MNRYLLDTNIWIFLLREQLGIDARIKHVGTANCFLSEIALAELRYGAEKSDRREKSHKLLDDLESEFEIVPITGTIREYARQKARLKIRGKTVNDMDLLIGVTALVNEMVLVTGNVHEFSRIEGLTIEDWTMKQV